LAAAEVCDAGDEDGGGDVAGVAACFGALGADEVDAGGEGFGDVFGGSDLYVSFDGLEKPDELCHPESQIERTMFITGILAAWSLSTAHFGGTPTAETKRWHFSAIMMSMSSSSLPCVNAEKTLVVQPTWNELRTNDSVQNTCV